MKNEFLSETGREDFRKKFPQNSEVVPVDLLARAHLMLAALDNKDQILEGFDRELAAMLAQALEHPAMFASTNDGLHTLVWVTLHVRGMLHGDSSLWRVAVQSAYADDVLQRARQTASLPDYGAQLRPWIETFERLLEQQA